MSLLFSFIVTGQPITPPLPDLKNQDFEDYDIPSAPLVHSFDFSQLAP